MTMELSMTIALLAALAIGEVFTALGLAPRNLRPDAKIQNIMACILIKNPV